MDFFDFLDLINQEFKRIGWSLSKANKYVLDTYGKKTRYRMTDEQLFEFYEYLCSLPNKKTLKVSRPKIGLKK